MGKYGWLSVVSIGINAVIALQCGAALYGIHWWTAVTHVIVVSCAAFVCMGCTVVAWAENDRSPLFMFHYRQLALLSIHLLAIGGYLRLFEEYAKFSSDWSPSKVRTAPPHELTVEQAWIAISLAHLTAFAFALPGLKAAADYLKDKPVESKYSDI
jgi:hypothetical protein